jgi:transcriptional regulator with XRE-family HTH domain
MDIKKEVGEKIKRFRKRNGFTQEKLAEIVDISSRNLSNIELGLSYPKPETLEKIMIALNMTTEELFSNDNLKTDDELLNEINKFISEAKTDRLKLEKVYRILKTLVE